jgi:hypothetical protein
MIYGIFFYRQMKNNTSNKQKQIETAHGILSKQILQMGFQRGILFHNCGEKFTLGNCVNKRKD